MVKENKSLEGKICSNQFQEVVLCLSMIVSNACFLFSVTAQDIVDIIKAQLQRYHLSNVHESFLVSAL